VKIHDALIHQRILSIYHR